MGDETPKRIIIDEDWKTQVEREKEELQRKQPAPPAAATGSEPARPADAIPAASFELLLTTLATEAMVSLGQVPHPASGQPYLDLEHAQHFIDTLAVLEEKTRGNLTPQEAELLTAMLHELRLVFVAVRKQLQAQRPATAVPPG